jgi:hypothetical protein
MSVMRSLSWESTKSQICSENVHKSGENTPHHSREDAQGVTRDFPATSVRGGRFGSKSFHEIRLIRSNTTTKPTKNLNSHLSTLNNKQHQSISATDNSSIISSSFHSDLASKRHLF